MRIAGFIGVGLAEGAYLRRSGISCECAAQLVSANSPSDLAARSLLLGRPDPGASSAATSGPFATWPSGGKGLPPAVAVLFEGAVARWKAKRTFRQLEPPKMPSDLGN